MAIPAGGKVKTLRVGKPDADNAAITREEALADALHYKSLYLQAADERDRYREALERVYQTGKGVHVEIAREALNRG